jgi:hypothetical protein
MEVLYPLILRYYSPFGKSGPFNKETRQGNNIGNHAMLPTPFVLTELTGGEGFFRAFNLLYGATQQIRRCSTFLGNQKTLFVITHKYVLKINAFHET